MLENWIGVPGIFWLTAVMAMLAIGVVLGPVPRPANLRLQRDTEVVTSALGRVVKNKQLLRLDLSIFMLHMVMTANFVVIPGVLRDTAGLPAQWHWLLYLAVLLGSFIVMLPLIIYAERFRRMKPVLLGAILLLAIGQFSFIYSTSLVTSLAVSMLIFFTCFNLLEATLPSMVSKLSPPSLRGTSMGVYSSSQFMGVFIGGALGGWLLSVGGPPAVFAGGGVAALIWVAAMAGMKNPSHLSSYMLNVGPLTAEHAKAMVDRLVQVKGVAEAVVIPEDGVAYLKVDRKLLDEATLREFSASAA